jgi:AcrR family transcriptional regulator
LLAERRFEDISVSDITDRATVNRATFYAHFEDKEHLANTLLNSDLEEALLGRLAPPAPFSRSSCTEVASAVFEFLDGMKQVCPEKALDPAIGATLQEAIRAFLERWMKHDRNWVRLFPDASRESVLTVLSWSIYGAASRWCGLARRPSATEAASEVISLIFSARST